MPSPEGCQVSGLGTCYLNPGLTRFKQQANDNSTDHQTYPLSRALVSRFRSRGSDQQAGSFLSLHLPPPALSPELNPSRLQPSTLQPCLQQGVYSSSKYSTTL